MRKRVLFIHHGSAYGGAPLSLLCLLQAMNPDVVEPIVCSALDSRDVLDLFACHGFNICAVELLPFKHTTGGAYAYCNPRDWGRLLEWLRDYSAGRRRLAELLAWVKPDVVHLNSLVLAPYACVPHAMGIPTVVHVRESVLRGACGVRKAWLEHHLSAYAAKVVVICQDNFRSLRLHADNGVVIYEPLDFVKFDARLTRQQARDELEIAADARVTLFAGGSVPEIKGQAEYLAAMAIVRQAEPRLLCLMPSFLPDRPPVRRWLSPRRYDAAVQQFITRQGLASCIMGTAFRLDIERFLAAADVVCVPHIRPHFSRTVIEAGAMKKPVAAFCIGGVEEVVRDNETGLLVPVGDVRGLAAATARLLADPPMARLLGEGGYRQARAAFDARACAAATEQVYAEITGEALPDTAAR